MKPVRLYYHQTDGGAEYLYDTFVGCPNGQTEGSITPETQFSVRLDGDPELRLYGAAAKAPELLECLKGVVEAFGFIDPPPRMYEGFRKRERARQSARALIAEIEGVAR